MGFGSAKPPNVGKHKSKMTNRNVQHRAAKALAKANKGTTTQSHKPVGRDKKKTQIVARRAAHHKRALEAAAAKAAGGGKGAAGAPKGGVAKAADLAAIAQGMELDK
jgi:hypothetical protein